MTTRLYGPIQGRLKRNLARFSPQAELYSPCWRELSDFYLDQSRNWPDRATVVAEKKTRQSLDGASVLRHVGEDLIERWSRHPMPLLPSLRFHFSRWKLRVRYKVVRIPLRELFAAHFLEDPSRSYAALRTRQQKTRSDLASKVDDLWQAVRFNLELAAAELENATADPSSEELQHKTEEIRHLIDGALERGTQAVRELEAPLSETMDATWREIQSGQDARSEALRVDIDRAGTLRGQAHWKLWSLWKVLE